MSGRATPIIVSRVIEVSLSSLHPSVPLGCVGRTMYRVRPQVALVEADHVERLPEPFIAAPRLVLGDNPFGSKRHDRASATASLIAGTASRENPTTNPRALAPRLSDRTNVPRENVAAIPELGRFA